MSKPFKINDLMINVLSGTHVDGGCGGTSEPTGDFCITSGILGTDCYCSCSAQSGPVTGIFLTLTITPITTPWNFGVSPVSSAEALAILKQQLKDQQENIGRQIVSVEKMETMVESRLLPQTVEEVDMLTKKLNEALKELKARRTALAKKAPPSRKK